MTPTQFLTNEVPTFGNGELIVVSGTDLASIYVLLSDAQTALVGLGKTCPDPIDTRATIAYPDGTIAVTPAPTVTTFKSAHFFPTPKWAMVRMTSGPNIGLERTVSDYDATTQVLTITPAFPVAPAASDGFIIEPPNETAYKFEALHVQYRAAGSTPGIILVGNQFDRGNPDQNPRPADVEIDVVRDLLNIWNVRNVPDVASSGDTDREIFSWINRVYYYDAAANDIVFVKTQAPGSPAPQIITVTPCTGPISGGTIVEINGANFRQDTTVRFGTFGFGVKLDVQSTVLIQCRTPQSSILGFMNVTVKNRDGQFDIALNAFQYI
jgi:hypothetical protein